MAHVRRNIGRGLILVLPLVVTVWLLALLFGLINDTVAPMIVALLRRFEYPWLDLWPTRAVVAVVGLAVTAGLIYLIGLFGGNLIGRRILSVFERVVLRIPLVKGIYGAARQLLDAFTATGAQAFSKVVILEYPRPGLWVVGFVTRERAHGVDGSGRLSDTVPVFLPTTPNPTSGWMILVARQELLLVDMTIEEAVKLVVSGGIVGPEDLATRVRQWV